MATPFREWTRSLRQSSTNGCRTNSFSLLSSSSTLAKPHDDSSDDLVSNLRAEALFKALISSDKVWVENPQVDTPSLSMIGWHLAQMDIQYHSLASTLEEITQMDAFVATVAGETDNKKKFGDLVATITLKLVDSNPNRPNIKYNRSGDTVMVSRTENRPTDGRGLKPDFFTSSVQQDPSTGKDIPLSVSTITSQHAPGGAGPSSHRKRAQRTTKFSASTENNLEIFKNDGSFTWEDVHEIWEIKSSSSDLDQCRSWSKVTLKASEVLRFQWHRQFVRGFLVCGMHMRMFYFSRSCVLVSLPVNISDGSSCGRLIFAKCLLASLVLQPAAVGFSINHHNPQTIEVEGRPRFVIRVGQDDFVLGDQIFWPQKSPLIGRATTVHLARRMEDQEWNLCYKSSWPEDFRPHEGIILDDLQGIEGVVRVLAWNALSPMYGAFATSYIHENFLPCNIPSMTKKKQKPEGASFYDRQHRQIVTEYLPYCISNQQLSLVELLQIWKSLYTVVGAIANRGWVHRDLSWTNIRLVRRLESWYPTLIDFDLATSIVGTSTGSPERTGTPIFMPIQILKQNVENDFCRYQELHEDESVFWVGFLAFLSCSSKGRKEYNFMLSCDLKNLANAKSSMVTLGSHIADWHNWFNKTAQMEVVQEALAQIIQLQFGCKTWGLIHTYPSVEELDDQGQRVHLIQHEVVLADVVKELETAIGKLKALKSNSC